MCLGVPGKVQSIYEQDGARMGKVNFGGIVKDVCLAYVPEIQVGDYTIVHVGFALTRIDEASAQQTLAMFSELGILDEELNPDAHESTAQPDACPVDPWDQRGAARRPA
jgi:hydrogenase expression/formation protein HypC